MITLKSPTPKFIAPISRYNLIGILEKRPTQISILEVLCLSPEHKALLDKELSTATVSIDLHVDQFQVMVGHITSHHTPTFTGHDESSMHQPHNSPLHIEACVHKVKIK